MQILISDNQLTVMWYFCGITVEAGISSLRNFGFFVSNQEINMKMNMAPVRELDLKTREPILKILKEEKSANL